MTNASGAFQVRSLWDFVRTPLLSAQVGLFCEGKHNMSWEVPKVI